MEGERKEERGITLKLLSVVGHHCHIEYLSLVNLRYSIYTSKSLLTCLSPSCCTALDTASMSLPTPYRKREILDMSIKGRREER